jgi:hypothetical protein
MNKRDKNDYYGLRAGIERKALHLFPIHILTRSNVGLDRQVFYLNTKKKGNNENLYLSRTC